jgi:hypothetical protein
MPSRWRSGLGWHDDRAGMQRRTRLQGRKGRPRHPGATRLWRSRRQGRERCAARSGGPEPPRGWVLAVLVRRGADSMRLHGERRPRARGMVGGQVAQLRIFRLHRGRGARNIQWAPAAGPRRAEWFQPCSAVPFRSSVRVDHRQLATRRVRNVYSRYAYERHRPIAHRRRSRACPRRGALGHRVAFVGVFLRGPATPSLPTRAELSSGSSATLAAAVTSVRG